MKLNESQELAANHKDGPCLIVAVPGSGKTRLLVERTARLIESGVNPSSILCVTFTNKAATEMRERIYERLGMDEGAKQPFFIGTFHSFCSKVLRGLGDRIGYGTFNIIDDGDQKDLLAQIGRQAGQKISKPECGYIASVVNNWRESLEDEDRLEERMKDDSYVAIALTYLERIKANQLIDFSGLLCEVLRLFDEHPHLLEKMQNRFEYIQVDEVQDTNFAQFSLINRISANHDNVFVVGDLSQCVIEGSMILTPSGDVLASSIKEGDEIIVGVGGGRSSSSCVESVYKKKVNNLPAIKITTHRGKSLITTKEHIYFAGYTPEGKVNYHFVYLMYKKGMGYRIGITRKYGHNPNQWAGCKSRINQEGADKIWLLDAVDNLHQARWKEMYYASKYGLPTCPFKTRNRFFLSQNDIDSLFSSLDTKSPAIKLLYDKAYSISYPHHMPKCMSGNRSRNFNITLCGDARHSSLHRCSIGGSSWQDADAINDMGLSARSSKKGWRYETSVSDMGALYKNYELINTVVDCELIQQARLTEKTLPFMPASQVLRGMSIYSIDQDGNVVDDEVVNVEELEYTGHVIDLDVRRYHNFCANGILVHNSVYGWRGARCQNIVDFIDMHENCKQITLSLNYRSTPEIIAVADQLIRHNSSHMAEEFVTENPSGADVQCHGFQSQFEEAEYIGHQVMHVVNTLGYNPEDIAILYRMNSFSEPIEQVFAKCGISYQIIGGGSFYDRKEIKDCISMLRFLVNPHDGIAFHRICKCMGGIGDVTVGKIENDAISGNSDILQVVDSYAKDGKTKKVREACAKIGSLYRKEWDKVPTADLISDLTNGMDFEDHLQSYCKSDDEKFNERIENVKQLVDSAANSGLDVVKYLENVALVSTADKDSKEGQVSLMTCHAAKGLEFPVVFIIGVEKDILPHRRSVIESPDGLEEERRLCYVGMTRAKEHLMLSYCSYRRHYIGGRGATPVPSGPSMFLVESGLLKKEDVFQESRYSY